MLFSRGGALPQPSLAFCRPRSGAIGEGEKSVGRCEEGVSRVRTSLGVGGSREAASAFLTAAGAEGTGLRRKVHPCCNQHSPSTFTHAMHKQALCTHPHYTTFEDGDSRVRN